MAEESTLSEEQQITIRRQLEAVLGDNYDPEDGVRSQVRKALEESQIRNAATLAAQSTDMVLMDFMRLLYLNDQFADLSIAPPAIQYEMMELQSTLPIETTEPTAPYSGATYDISSGPEAVTGNDLAAAYVERHGANIADGPLDHSDTVITKADIQDAIERYESIEITDEQIAAYRADTMQQLVDSRMDVVDPADPEYATKLEGAQKWATEMGMPSESVIISALRQETFLEQNPEMQLSQEQAQALATSYGAPNTDIILQRGSVLAYYTDNPESRAAGMTNYMSERAGLLDDLETTRAADYAASISNQVAEISGTIGNVSALSYTVAGDSGTGIDRNAFEAKNAEMAAALESGDYNTALNIGNQLTETILADADTRQLAVLTDNFDALQASAESAGYTVESPADLQALLNSENGAEIKQEMMSQRWAAGTDAQNVFRSGEYTATESVRRDALATQSEIEVAAAKFEGVELAEVDTTELTTAAATQAEIAATPALNMIDVAKGIIDDNNGGAKYGLGEAIGHTFGEIDLDRLSMTREIIGFDGVPQFDVTTPEGMASTLIAMEVYATGEAPSAERIGELEDVVDTAFNDEHAVDLDTTNMPAAISDIFQRAHDATPAIGNIFGKSVVPEGYEARLQELQGNTNAAPTAPEERVVAPAAGALAM